MQALFPIYVFICLHLQRICTAQTTTSNPLNVFISLAGGGVTVVEQASPTTSFAPASVSGTIGPAIATITDTVASLGSVITLTATITNTVTSLPSASSIPPKTQAQGATIGIAVGTTAGLLVLLVLLLWLWRRWRYRKLVGMKKRFDVLGVSELHANGRHEMGEGGGRWEMAGEGRRGELGGGQVIAELEAGGEEEKGENRRREQG
ncbi:hypothetical protein MMC27_004913 [Xylographa pallens]|nr:hypothetical protein [Xylographa pallens]